MAGTLRAKLPWLLRAALVPIALYAMFLAVMQIVNPGYLFGGTPPLPGPASLFARSRTFCNRCVLRVSDAQRRKDQTARQTDRCAL